VDYIVCVSMNINHLDGYLLLVSLLECHFAIHQTIPFQNKSQDQFKV
jgi:hypothetical protein